MIHMQQCSIENQLNRCMDAVTFLIGDKHALKHIKQVQVLPPFSDVVIDCLNTVSSLLMRDSEAKMYSDIISFAFWIRKASLLKMRERFCDASTNIKKGRGIVFHIAPSNVPVNYAYSLCAGLLTGNSNIVKLPSKNFRQVEIINHAIECAIESYPVLQNYIFLVRYDRNKEINDSFSAIANVRMVWGGDETIGQLRKSGLQPRAKEITFADRYSIAVIDSDVYMSEGNKDALIKGFYDDTYLMDQNACTSPHFVIWIGEQSKEAKTDFWGRLHELVSQKYEYQDVMGVNKLTKVYLAAAANTDLQFEQPEDNLLYRVEIRKLSKDLIAYRGNAGLFYEYTCSDIKEIAVQCDDERCQTIGYYGKRECIMPLLTAVNRGIDRVVPIGHTMDFDMLWDGYNLYEELTRTIVVGV